MENLSIQAQKTRRSLFIGSALITGPTALYPPSDAESEEALLPILRLEFSPSDMVETQSMIVFAGDRLKRDIDPLTPVIIRHAHWFQRQDRLNLPYWPTINIELGTVQPPFDHLDHCIRAFHLAARQLPLVTLGLPTEQVALDLFGDVSKGFFNIFVNNYGQTIEFDSWGIDNEALTDLFFSSFELLRSIMHPISRNGWLEHYRHDLNNDLLYRTWDWDGRVPMALSNSH